MSENKDPAAPAGDLHDQLLGHISDAFRYNLDSALYGALGVALWFVLLVVVALLFFLSYQAEEHSFAQLVYAEFFGGCATFVLTPVAFRLRRHAWRLFYLLGLLASAGLCYAASQAHGIWRHILLELSAGIALLLLLETGFRYVLKLARKRVAEADALGASARDDADMASTALQVLGWWG